MTDPVHLDDEQLSAVLDGLVDDRGGHVAGCAPCSGRLAALAAARDAVAAAGVPPLAPFDLDALVDTAIATLDEPEIAPVVPLAPRRRRLTTPPPAWLLGAVASIALLAGLAGLLRAGGSGDDAESGSGDSAAASRLPAGDEGLDAAGPVAGVAADPEVVAGDLGDVDDPSELAAALNTVTAFAARGTTTAGGAGGKAAQESAEADGEQGADAPAADDTATTFAGSDRAQCVADAERIGSGRLGALLSTSTLRWAGRPAEVLVFALTEPAAGVSRQALVLARPGCALLADPRF